jgi:hypothetical protein
MDQQAQRESAFRATVLEYFRRADAGSGDLTDLFSEDIEFYFPKYGVGVGKGAWSEFLSAFAANVAAIAHKTDDFRWHGTGSTVVVEGTTTGQLKNGRAWDGGTTPGGRFCSVFDMDSMGLITRMYIYLDPDYGSSHEAHFWWAEQEKARKW